MDPNSQTSPGRDSPEKERYLTEILEGIIKTAMKTDPSHMNEESTMDVTNVFDLANYGGSTYNLVEVEQLEEEFFHKTPAPLQATPQPIPHHKTEKAFRTPVKVRHMNFQPQANSTTE